MVGAWIVLAVTSSSAGAPQDFVSRALRQWQLRADAEQAWRDGDHAGALARYRELTEIDPDHPDDALRCGQAAARVGELRVALGPLERAFRLGASTRAEVAVQLAEVHARLDQPSSALEWLQRAKALRAPSITSWLERPAFRALRAEPEFESLIARTSDASIERDDGWRHDLRFLVQEAQRLNPDPSRPAHSPEFLAAATEIEDSIAFIADDEMALELQRLLTLLGDGHARVAPANWRFFPVELYWFADGLFVVGGDGVDAAHIGKRVVRVGDLSPTEALSELELYVPRDNPMGLIQRGVLLLRTPEVLRVLGAGDENEMNLVLETSGGDEEPIRCEGARSVSASYPRISLWPQPAWGEEETPRYLRRRDELWFHERVADEVVYAQINAIADNAPGSFERWTRALLAECHAETTTLILDLRHNPGGNSFLLPPLVRATAALACRGPPCRTVVLIGRWTYSAAQNLANALDRWVEPVFIGEPTGSRPNFVGEDAPFSLPFSGLEANISPVLHQSSIYDDRIWIAPDVRVGLASDDYFSARDPVLEVALEIARR